MMYKPEAFAKSFRTKLFKSNKTWFKALATQQEVKAVGYFQHEMVLLRTMKKQTQARRAELGKLMPFPCVLEI